MAVHADGDVLCMIAGGCIQVYIRFGVTQKNTPNLQFRGNTVINREVGIKRRRAIV